MTVPLTIGQRAAIGEVARSAGEDVAAYRPPGSMPWCDEALVGRMLVRDQVIASLLPIALAALDVATARIAALEAGLTLTCFGWGAVDDTPMTRKRIAELLALAGAR